MALAEKIEPTFAGVNASDAGELRGRVDAIDGSRLFGWAWNPRKPDQRLTVRVLADGEVVATIVADRTRIDLRRNGIGDGGHAFDIDLPATVVAEAGRLAAVAVHPDGGPDLDLPGPSDVERAAEAAVSAPLGAILDRLDAALHAQRRVHGGQAQILRDLGAATRQLGEIAGGEGIAAAVQELRAGQDVVAGRVTELEVFIVRFDGVIGEFQRRLETLARQDAHGVRGHLLVLAGGVGVLCGIALMAALRI